MGAVEEAATAGAEAAIVGAEAAIAGAEAAIFAHARLGAGSGTSQKLTPRSVRVEGG